MLPELREARDALSRLLHESPGARVTGIGIGLRVTHGTRLSASCLQVFVEHKKPRQALGHRERIPSALDGIDIDIAASARPVLCGSDTSRAIAQKKVTQRKPVGRSRYRPLVGGVSCANLYVCAGTLGCFCTGKNSRGNDATFILGCGHVLRGAGGYKTSPNVIQASPSDGGTSRDAVAAFDRGLPLSADLHTVQYGDAALAELLPGVEYKNELLGIGALQGNTIPALGMHVRKSGRTTGVTNGVVCCVALETWVPWNHENSYTQYRFSDLIRIESQNTGQSFAQPGDSGALVVTAEDTRAAALYFAGADDGAFGLATPIGRIEELLAVRLCHSS